MLSRLLIIIGVFHAWSAEPARAQSQSPAADRGSAQENLSAKEDWPSPVEDSETYGFFLADLLEYTPAGSSGALAWDLLGWRGGDYNRFWIKSEGLQSGRLSGGGTADIEALYGRLIWPFFDAQVGVAYNRIWNQEGPGAGRLQGVLSLQGLSPYSFELEPVLFISQKGNISFRFTAEQDFLMTQRLILQPRLEFNAALQGVPEFDVNPGFNDLALGARLRYEIRREIAPYVGLNWNFLFGQKAASASAPEQQGLVFVAGLRAWY